MAFVATVAAVVSPVALYINVPASARTGEGLIHVIPILCLIIFLTFCVYFVWISAIDLIQQRLTERFGDNFLLEFNFLAVVLTIFLSTGIAALHVVTFQQLIRTMMGSLWNCGLPFYPKIWPRPFPPKHLFLRSG